jgi:hypothetical protein
MAAIRLAGIMASRKSIREWRGRIALAALVSGAVAMPPRSPDGLREPTTGRRRPRRGLERNGARRRHVELYPAAGGAIVADTTNASGVYSLNSGRTAPSMIVRVVNGSVRSARTGRCGLYHLCARADFPHRLPAPARR